MSNEADESKVAEAPSESTPDELDEAYDQVRKDQISALEEVGKQVEKIIEDRKKARQSKPPGVEPPNPDVPDKKKDKLKSAPGAFAKYGRRKGVEKLNLLHVETLLDQAADLLDRVLTNRATYDSLSASDYQQKVLVAELEQLIKVAKAEIEEGKFEQRSNELGEEIAIAEGRVAKLERLYANRKKHNEVLFSDDAIAKQKQLAGSFGFFSVSAPYYIHPDGSEGKKKPYFIEQLIWKAPVIDSGYHAPDTLMSAMSRLRANYALTDQEFSAGEAEYSLLVDYGTALLQAENLMTMKKGVDRDAANAKKRAAILEQKRQALIDGYREGGKPLDFGKRLEGLRMRIDQDFNEAQDRMEAVELGLRSVFQRSVDLPKADKDAEKYFDECLVWVRQQIQWLIRYKQNDQEMSVPISLKNIDGKSNFEIGGNDRVSFRVDKDVFFPDAKDIRLKAISAIVISSKTKAAFCNMTVTPPSMDGKAAPDIRLPRATAYSESRVPDVAGLKSLKNRNPVGQWEVSISGITPLESSSGDDENAPTFKDIENIIIQAHVTYQPE